MRTLLLGGTGEIGQAVAAELSAAGHDVRALASRRGGAAGAGL